MSEEPLSPPSAVYIGQSTKPEFIHLKMATRHGLITGATGNGRKVTLQGLAEGFSDQGVSVFCVDLRGDLSGLAAPGKPEGWVKKRADKIGYEPNFCAYPVTLWDLLGERGHDLGATVEKLGPVLVSQLLETKESQVDVLRAIFQVAKVNRLPLVELKDLQALVGELTERLSPYGATYGITRNSLERIASALQLFEMQGANRFIGKPQPQVSDLVRRAPDGRGYINILSADRYVASTRFYTAFQHFLLVELARQLPYAADRSEPRLIFFFESSELLFRSASAHLLHELDRALSLGGQKGVGVYFLASSIADVPAQILSQLGNCILLGSRASIAAERRALKHFRPNPLINDRQVLTTLGTGEALVSTLDLNGEPTMVERTLIKPPNSRWCTY